MKKMADERDDVIVLKDENGQEIEFEYLDTIEKNGKEYIVLLPLEEVNDDEEGEVVILQVKTLENEEEEYLPVEDENELNAVFEDFKERMKDEYDFEDEDEGNNVEE
jgi:uncharacterized protein YrzB (UPF0473 family)